MNEQSDGRAIDIIPRITATQILLTTLIHRLFCIGVLREEDIRNMEHNAFGICGDMKEDGATIMQIGGDKVGIELAKLFEIVRSD